MWEVIPSSDGLFVAALRGDEVVVVWDAAYASEVHWCPRATKTSRKFVANSFAIGWEYSTTVHESHVTSSQFCSPSSHSKAYRRSYSTHHRRSAGKGSPFRTAEVA
jgi:hypothetical protein